MTRDTIPSKHLNVVSCKLQKTLNVLALSPQSLPLSSASQDKTNPSLVSYCPAFPGMNVTARFLFLHVTGTGWAVLHDALYGCQQGVWRKHRAIFRFVWLRWHKYYLQEYIYILWSIRWTPIGGPKRHQGISQTKGHWTQNTGMAHDSILTSWNLDFYNMSTTRQQNEGRNCNVKITNK